MRLMDNSRHFRSEDAITSVAAGNPSLAAPYKLQHNGSLHAVA